MVQRDLARPVLRTADDQDLADDPRLLEALLAPLDEVADGELLVGGGNDDRELRLLDVLLGDEGTTSGSESPTTWAGLPVCCWASWAKSGGYRARRC